jgi:hypothetical protein
MADETPRIFRHCARIAWDYFSATVPLAILQHVQTERVAQIGGYDSPFGRDIEYFTTRREVWHERTVLSMSPARSAGDTKPPPGGAFETKASLMAGEGACPTVAMPSPGEASETFSLLVVYSHPRIKAYHY